MQQSQTPSEAGISLSHPRVAGTACTTTSTPTTPTNAKSSGPCEMGVSADSPSATTGAMTEEEDVEQDDGTTVALAKSGVTDLMRIAGRTSLARAPGGISLARTARRVTQAFLHCRHRQEGMTTIIRTRGLGASRSHVLLLASWVELRPQPLSAFSSSLLAK